MKITRRFVAERLAAYLRHETTTAELVEWAEQAILDGEFDPEDVSEVRDVVARLGLADVRAFGLTWEDSEGLLARLGYTARIEINAAK